MILQFIDRARRARRAQQQHDRRVDVQLPLMDVDHSSPRSPSTSGTTGEPAEAHLHGDARGRAGALGQGLTAETPEPSPIPLARLEVIARSADRLRATFIRCVEADTGLSVDELVDLADVLETITRYARADVTVPEPRSLRVPTLRVVR